MSDRCDKCLWAEIINSQDGWSFIGCTHEPYKGKWVTEIKDCPKEREKDAKRMDIIL